MIISNKKSEDKGTSNSKWIQYLDKLMYPRRSFTDPLSKEWEDGYVKDGITLCHGNAKFNGQNGIQ